MPTGAPRRAARCWRRFARGVLPAMALAAWFGSAPVAAEGVVTARFGAETTRYAHAVLGDAIEYGALILETSAQRRLRIVLPEHSVFEDLAPRVIDLDFDGEAEVVVVESHRDLGAQLAIYGPQGKIAATPHIGRTNRWLAPIGAADLDGDGAMEIAYIDRPHLAKTLRVWRFADRGLTEIAQLPGLTNHRIGQDFISGGVRDCGSGPELIVARGDWSGLVAVRLSPNGLQASDAPGPASPDGFARALACP